MNLKTKLLDTPVGSMIAIGSEEALYLLEFVDQRGFDHEVERLQKRTKSVITPGSTTTIVSIEHELNQYFNHKLTEFNTPLCLIGSPFQQSVWETLKKIPYGETQSYSNLATTVQKPTAFRAVANANGANRLAIVIPCHRVINLNGELGGYAGGIARKKWLINHESTFLQAQ